MYYRPKFLGYFEGEPVYVAAYVKTLPGWEGLNVAGDWSEGAIQEIRPIQVTPEMVGDAVRKSYRRRELLAQQEAITLELAAL
jgi:hypothetical protein